MKYNSVIWQSHIETMSKTGNIEESGESKLDLNWFPIIIALPKKKENEYAA